MGKHRHEGPAYSDVLYVERLIAPGVINTMPVATLRAFAEHGNVERALGTDVSDAEATLAAAEAAGVELGRITAVLEREGVESFCTSYDDLLRCIETKVAAVAA